MEPVKKFSPAFYGVIVILFFLPFVNLSCGGQTIMSLTGFQLMTGTEYQPANMFGGEMGGEIKENKKIDAQPLALLAFIATVLGLALAFVKIRAIALGNIIISVAGVVFLILLKINMDADAELNVPGQNVLTLDYQFAYWLSIILFIAAAVVQWKIFADDAPAKVNVLG